jgi:hypothetical protein
MVLSETPGLALFLIIREGLGSGVRLGARSTQRLTNQCLENPTATARENLRDERTRLHDGGI